jgi:hypothetical protein
MPRLSGPKCCAVLLVPGTTRTRSCRTAGKFEVVGPDGQVQHWCGRHDPTKEAERKAMWRAQTLARAAQSSQQHTHLEMVRRLAGSLLAYPGELPPHIRTQVEELRAFRAATKDRT